MRRVCIALALLYGSAVSAATLYVSATAGSGQDCSASTPCRPVDVWDPLNSSDTVMFNKGRYAGVNFMVNPPDTGLDNVIMKCADTSGEGCFLDGTWTEDIILDLRNLSGWTIEGFNACCVAHDTSSSFDISTTQDSAGMVFIANVFWDGPDNGWGAWSTQGQGPPDTYTYHHVFGLGRKQLTVSGNGVGTGQTYRYASGVQEMGTTRIVKMGYSFGYEGSDRTCENCIVESSLDILNTYTDGTEFIYMSDANDANCANATCLTENPCASSGANTNIRGAISIDQSPVANSHIYGSIAMNTSAVDCYDTGTNNGAIVATGAGTWTDWNVENVVTYHTGSSTTNKGFNLSATVVTSDVADTTSIAAGTDVFGTGWTATDNQHADITATSPPLYGLADSIYEGAGARLCNRYVDRVQTSLPMWPWPFNQRIVDVMTKVSTNAPSDSGHQHPILGHTSNCLVTNTPDCTAALITEPHTLVNWNARVVSRFGRPPVINAQGEKCRARRD